MQEKGPECYGRRQIDNWANKFLKDKNDKKKKAKEEPQKKMNRWELYAHV
jgi:hypothetical protein